MNEALFESFAKELTALVARDEAGRGASKLSSPRELMRAALAFRARRVEAEQPARAYARSLGFRAAP